MERFSADSLTLRVREAGLVLPSKVLERVIAALQSGEHVVLTGLPGTGKTTLAQLVGELAHEAVLSTGSLTVTASPDWTVADTVGWYEENEQGPIFHPGVFLQAIAEGRWLVVDELNRADLDVALGPLFTVLSHQAVVLPFRRTALLDPIAIVPAACDPPPDVDVIRVPDPWRIVATMNNVDRGELHHLSRALLRRFAFIELPSPSDGQMRELLAGPGAFVGQLLPLRSVAGLGPALFISGARFAEERSETGVAEEDVLEEVLEAYFVPQLDGVLASVAESPLSRQLSPAAQTALERVVRRFGPRAQKTPTTSG